jgi:hypothetical protein
VSGTILKGNQGNHRCVVHYEWWFCDRPEKIGEQWFLTPFSDDTITWVCSMSCTGRTCRKHWLNIIRTSVSVGVTIVSSESSGRQDDKREG